jgi:hypothetical protein
MPSIGVAGLDPDFSPYPDLSLNKYVNLPIAVSEPEADYPGGRIRLIRIRSKNGTDLQRQ